MQSERKKSRVCLGCCQCVFSQEEKVLVSEVAHLAW